LSETQTTIAYIDGFNLYHGLKQRFGHRYLWLDLVKIVRRLRPADDVRTVRYFTAMVRDNAPAEARQSNYLRALKAHNGDAIDIVVGRYQSKQRTCRTCGASWTQYEEKETDVNIAVSLVADSASWLSDLALIISADSDLCPAIRTSRQVSPTRGMIAAFPPKRSSFEIKTLIPGAFPIGPDKLRNSLLPDIVNDPTTGEAYKRPGKWR
jgi:hypothetical protein